MDLRSALLEAVRPVEKTLEEVLGRRIHTVMDQTILGLSTAVHLYLDEGWEEAGTTHLKTNPASGHTEYAQRIYLPEEVIESWQSLRREE